MLTTLAPWLPACPFRQLTGLLCPGCGATRAMLALLHGDVARAWRLNPLLLAWLPLLLAYLALGLYRRSHRRGWPAVPRPVTAALFGAALLFTIFRNR